MSTTTLEKKNSRWPQNAEELFELLEPIKIGGRICRYPRSKCQTLFPLIQSINQLKQQRNAIILAHSYVSPEIQYGVADFSGDSYKLSKQAKETDADVIVFAAVRFMAETAKILNPNKKVYMPATLGGCSLADSITHQDVLRLRKRYPKHTFLCYINTSAAVKALCDVVVTSSNVFKIVQNYPNDKIYFLPDKLMGENIIVEMKRRGVKKEILSYPGTCYVHETYDSDMVDFMKAEYSQLQVVVHPECKSEVNARADFVGSTSQMMQFVKESPKKNFFMLTECGLSSRLQQELPNKNFHGSCTLCRYMKSNSLENIQRVLKNPLPSDEIHIDKETLEKARLSLAAMFRYS